MNSRSHINYFEISITEFFPLVISGPHFEMFRMNRTLLTLALVATFCAGSLALEDYPLGEIDYEEDAGESRFLLVNSNSTSVTIGYNTFALGVASALALLGLLGLAVIWAAGGGQYDSSGYGQSGYSDYSSGYARKSYVSLSQFLSVVFCSFSVRPFKTKTTGFTLQLQKNAPFCSVEMPASVK